MKYFETETEQGRLRIEFHDTAIRVKNTMLKNQKRYFELLILYKHTEGNIKYKYAWELMYNIEEHLGTLLFIETPVILEILEHWKETRTYSTDAMPDLKFDVKVKEENIVEEVEKFVDSYIKLKRSKL